MLNQTVPLIDLIDNQLEDNNHPLAEPDIVENPAITQLRSDILAHIESLRLPASDATTLDKEMIRNSHSQKRQEVIRHEWQVVEPHVYRLIENFANGDDVNPEKIKPELVPVISDQWTGNLFRLATLLWSVPVSHGFGRRMRFLVRDQYNGKLIGIFALGDPVFNLQCRDQWIGWNVDDRRERLVNLMDAYVVGAVPPYNELLGGKLIASLIGSSEVSQAFSNKYGDATGVISGRNKAPRLMMVTVTSALGHSSLYNRLKLKDGEGNSLVELLEIGETRGYGHFQLSNDLFERIRQLLDDENHPYANGHKFGQGPNWRIRVIRVGLKRLGLDENLIKHGIHRKVYAMPMATGVKDFLCGRSQEINLNRPTLDTISSAALNRWVIPRSIRRPQYRRFQRYQVLDQIGMLLK